MSEKNAERFLGDVTHRQTMRDRLETAKNPEEFIKICQELGYDFTHDELESVIKHHSEGVFVRRKVGVWPWLRHVNWR